MTSSADKNTPVIDAQQVSKIYDGLTPVKALNDINFRVEKGEWVSIVGPSGSGKSTLLHLLGCLDKPSSGVLCINGIDISECSDVELSAIRATTIGFIFQQFHLLPGRSALENVMLSGCYLGISRKERLERSRQALDSVGLSKRIDHLPNQLSGGERQRVAIARATVLQPALLLCDEPTGNLDSKNTVSVLEIIRSFHDEGSTIVVITHDDKVAQHSQRQIYMSDGKIQGS